MNEIFPNIYQIFPSKQTPSKYRSFFVKCDEGNLLIPCFSTNSTIESHFDAIAELGGLSRQLLGDSHFKSPHCDQVAERFNAPLYCSEGEAPDVTRVVKQVVIFPFTRHLLEPQIEVIPTPGHRSGGVCYLISMLEKRYLFVGDFIWHDGEKWIPTATKANFRDYIESLHLLEGIAFDVLLANSKISNPTHYVELNQDTRKAFIADLLAQVNVS
ncbi:MAG: hypothetical protein H7Y09_06125 [Chitinophagaceae bacterium]|nr:hypothetical protein [Anaerolineae bacterium]